MKHLQLLLLGLLFILILPQNLFSQAPDGVNYQAVVRGPLGLPLSAQPVSVRFTIHQGSPTGTSVFQEVHVTSTNQFGLINLELGSVNNGAFSVINWGTGGAYYLQIEVDPGSGFDDLGASQLLSVPYALFAKSAATGAQGFNSLIDTVAATSAACPTGGYVVLTGLDANANTVLDPGEVSSSFAVCNGTTGSAILSDTSATNEIQTLSMNTTNDTIFLSNGGGFVVLPSLGDNDWIIAGNDMSSGITGNVGIGVLLPSKKLSIRSLAPGGDGIEINNASATGNPGLEFQTQGTPRYVLGVDQTDNNKFKIGTTNVNVNTRFTIDGLGNVGVGTTAPINQLTVVSNDTLAASFTSTNPDVAAIAVSATNPNAAAGILLLSGVDSGMIAVDPLNKTLWFTHSTPGGHTGIYADSAVALYGEVIGNMANSKIINQADTIYSFQSVGGNIININTGTFITDSLYKLGNNSGNFNWVLANDGFGQAVWTDPTTLPGGGGGLWQSSAPDIFFNTGNVSIGTATSSIHKLNIAGTIGTSLLKLQGNGNAGSGLTFGYLGAALGGYNIRSDEPGGLHFEATGSGVSDRISFEAGNIERMRITGVGNVGIGTTTPNALLDVTGVTETDNLRVLAGAGTAGDVLISDAAGNATWQNVPAISGWDLLGNSGTVPTTNFIGTTDAQDLAFRTNSLENMRIFNIGGVGIGTATRSGFVSIRSNPIGVFGQLSLQGDGAGNGNVSYMSFVDNANVRTGYIGDGSGADGDILMSSANGGLRFQTSAANRLFITSAGNVGIGTLIPNAKLDVTGVTETDDLRVITGAGTAGNVLTSDVSGNATWQSLPATSGDGIYTGSGSLSGATTVTQATNALTFNSTAASGFNIDNNVSGNRVLTILNITDGSPAYTAGSIGARVGVSAGGAQTVTGIESKVTGTTSNNKIGGWFSAEGTGTGWNRGLNTSARNSTGSNLGIDVTANGNSGTNYGMRVNMGGTGANTKYGLYVTSSATTNGTLYGLFLQNNGLGTKYGVFSNGEDLNYFSGNVGIGTAAPTTKLDVIGKVKITDGTEAAGNVLVSDAAGIATWKPNAIAFESYMGGSWAVPSGPVSGSSPINFDNVNFNDGGDFDPTPGANRFIASTKGVYAIEATLLLNYSGGGPNETVYMVFIKNGVLPAIKGTAITINPGEEKSISISTTMRLNPGEAIHVEVYSNTGSPITIAGSETVWFSGHLVYAD